MENLGIEVTCSGAEEATEKLEQLADAADRACAALTSLNNQAHGGIVIQIVGDLCKVDIKPSSAE